MSLKVASGQSTQEPRPIQRRWAFLVGIDVYVEPTCQQLNFCVHDVVALEQVLVTAGYTVVSLYDGHPAAHRRPTRDNVQAELLQLCQQVEPDDLVFGHFACHGVLIDGLPILMMQDSRRSLLGNASKRLAVADVESMLRQSGARRLVLSLDACHMGVERGRAGGDPQFMRNVYDLAEGFVLLAGSTAQQLAQEWNQVRHGVYTYFLLEALSGQADRSNKAFVTVSDVHAHVVNGLKKWLVANSGLIQEPTVKVEGMGDMILVDWRDKGGAPGMGFQQVSSAEPNLSARQLQLPDMNDTRREFYMRQIQRKKEDLAAVEYDLSIPQSAVNENRLRKQAEQLLQDIEGLEQKLGKNSNNE